MEAFLLPGKDEKRWVILCQYQAVPQQNQDLPYYQVSFGRRLNKKEQR
jgi:hypothetical protein